MLEGITLEQAVEELMKYVHPVMETEKVPVLQSVGRILAEDICAEFSNPPFDRSPVDGYACKAEDLADASDHSPAKLKVLCEIDAGGYSHVTVRNGEAVRIMTGAAIPAGCDCCVYQEKTDYGETEVEIYAPVKKWQNYCFAGEDFQKGNVLLKKDTKITFIETGILSSLGLTEVTVYRRSKVALLTTGDEVTEPGKELLPGKIYNINLTLLAARMTELGVEIVTAKTVEDNPMVMAEELIKASSEADFVVTTGGVSVGKKDICHEATSLADAEKVFWRVSLKPGMPTLFTVIKEKPVLSLSGNPFGVAVTAEVLLRPMIVALGHDQSLALSTRRAIVRGTFGKVTKCRRMLRGKYADGTVTLPEGLQSNGVLSSMAGCNCLLDLPAGTPGLKDGDEITVILLS